MDLTKLSLTDLLLFQEVLSVLIEDCEQPEAGDRLEEKFEKVQQELLNRIDTI